MLHGLSYAGLNLASPAIRAVDLSGALSVPERIGENVPVLGRHGTVRVAGKRYGGRDAPFSIRVYDCAADGTIAADPGVALDANLDQLGRALAADSGLLVHTMADGTVRQVLAEARAGIEGERNLAGTRVVVPVVFTTHEAFWRGAAPIAPTVSLTSGVTTAVPALGGGTAPVDDAVITFGPGPAPTFVDVATGRWVAYDDPIGAGRTLVLDCAEGRGYGTGGLVFDRRKLRTSGDGGWFELSPAGPAGPSVRLTLNGGGTMNVTLSARLAWIF